MGPEQKPEPQVIPPRWDGPEEYVDDKLRILRQAQSKNEAQER